MRGNVQFFVKQFDKPKFKIPANTKPDGGISVGSLLLQVIILLELRRMRDLGKLGAFGALGISRMATCSVR